MYYSKFTKQHDGILHLVDVIIIDSEGKEKVMNSTSVISASMEIEIIAFVVHGLHDRNTSRNLINLFVRSRGFVW